jgi:hypothetical protein
MIGHHRREGSPQSQQTGAFPAWVAGMAWLAVVVQALRMPVEENLMIRDAVLHAATSFRIVSLGRGCALRAAF